MWNLISTRVTQFDYFDRLLDRPWWKGSRVLDFGGNVGTFLVGAGDNVADEDYVCLDLNRSVVEQGDEPFRQRAACLAVRRHWQDLLRSIGMQHSGNRQFGRYR